MYAIRSYYDDLCRYDDTNWISEGSTTATLNGLVNGTTYYWQVRINLGSTLDPDYFYADNGDYWTFTTLPE